MILFYNTILTVTTSSVHIKYPTSTNIPTMATLSVNILLPQTSSILTTLATPTIPTVLDNTSFILALYIGLPLVVLLVLLTIILVVVSTVFIIVIMRYRKQYNG